MPTVLRRVSAWKGCLPQRRKELAADLRQELAVDCLQHPDIVCDLPPRARHTRWFRQLQRLLYRQHFRGLRSGDGETTIELVAAASSAAELQDGLDVRTLLQQDGRGLLQRLLRGADQMGNGRCNMSTTANRLGVHQHAVRAQWNELAAQLGFGSDFLHFWCRRLGEATLGWAADVLRQHAELRLHDEQHRRRPDPAARRRRIRRIRATVNIRPLPDELRRVLAELQRCRAADPRDALLLLDIAAHLDPFASAVQLWRFEALIATGDLGGAVTALRRARALGAAAVP
ncbi:MAG TPA: hypothetical protein VK348_00355, partial [Planctomycetota bacterium]|nr:hypothetical protein [Planctomycetota bacterium]